MVSDFTLNLNESSVEFHTMPKTLSSPDPLGTFTSSFCLSPVSF